MARCKLTNMNLRNIRKSKEYQCLLIDLVKASVIGKSAAEELLGYTIPAGLLGSSTPATPDDDDNDNEEEQGSGTEGSGTDTGVTVTLLYFDATANEGAGDWLEHEYTAQSNVIDDEAFGIITAARTAFTDVTIDGLLPAEQDPEYVEGTSALNTKYKAIDPRPTELTNGALIICYDIE